MHFVSSECVKYFFKFLRLDVFEGKGTFGEVKVEEKDANGRDRTEDKDKIIDNWLCFAPLNEIYERKTCFSYFYVLSI